MTSTSSSNRPPIEVRYITNPRATRFYYATVDGVGGRDFEIASGGYSPVEPVKAGVWKGGRPGDFLWNDRNLIIVSAKVLELFRMNGFSGYSAFDVRVTQRDKVVPGYHGISIIGRAGRVDYDRSSVQWFKNPDGTRGGIRAILGLYFDSQNWDGSDIFAVDDFPKAMLVVHKVWTALRKAKVTNFAAMPLAEFGFGYSKRGPWLG